MAFFSINSTGDGAKRFSGHGKTQLFNIDTYSLEVDEGTTAGSGYSGKSNNIYARGVTLFWFYLGAE